MTMTSPGEQHTLHGDGMLFLNDDPNFMLEGMNRFPPG